MRDVIKLRDKSALLNLESEQDVKLVEEGTGESLVTVRPGKISPRIIIFDVPKILQEDELISQLLNKNCANVGPINELKSEIKTLFRVKAKQGSNNAKDNSSKNHIVLSVSGRICRALVGIGRVFVDFNSFRVQEFVSITRCFRCQGFGHTSTVCRRDKVICSYCGGEGHNHKDCQNKSGAPCCFNCKLKKNDSGHEASQKTCPEYLRNLEMYKKKINYD